METISSQYFDTYNVPSSDFNFTIPRFEYDPYFDRDVPRLDEPHEEPRKYRSQDDLKLTDDFWDAMHVPEVLAIIRESEEA
mmetsp:Transcript_15184/g.16883  ORF Transcript_15184/g.16883 Transcript_15184/m.16883 type:complete len:81 (+) Transcript_15184:77-319(+)|eukprot:CAMPEP_0168530568 /NCGR_PEP_ID=MMETSP0405-20121227/14768_1 /TAXON_ID=498012 /ORGANISM="Trichosphaerium sp, Strain Am-I-7 wt" /LENGTH=80 /DNA_ID=CAMNT_0008554881 /DNA_START=63 /DNA_END=305 /DNA_ORIENTATION=+